MKDFDIKELDCEGMQIHPNSPQLVKFIEKNIPSFKKIKVEFKDKSFTKAMVYRYIVLMYDKESPIQKMHGLDWYEKKYEACAYAGFPLRKQKNGYSMFDERVLNMVTGKEDAVTDLIIEFIAFMNHTQWNYLIFLHESMLEFTRDAIGKKNRNAKTSKEFRSLYDDYYKISNEIGHIFKETEEFVSRFYYKIEQERLSVKPEDFAGSFADDDMRADNPYGVSYAVDQIKFLGDDEEQVRERLQGS